MRRHALVHAVVHTGAETLEDHAVVIDGGTVEAVVPSEDAPEGVPAEDLGGAHVAPGFVDLQVNGGGGVMLNDEPTADAVATIVAAHRRFGTTALLPTYVTGPTEGMRLARAAVDAYRAEGGRGVLGIHFEGPFLDPRRPGAHDARLVRAATAEDLDVVCEPRDGVTLLTLAAACYDEAVARRLADAGVVVSLGHCASSADEAARAFARGATLVTHLFNAMTPMQSRLPGLVGAALDHAARGAARCGLILDGVHVDFTTARVAVRAAGPGGVFLVSDAVAPVGTDDTEFTLGGRRCAVVDGTCVNEEGTLAGSVLDMATAVRNAVRELGLPLDEALRMASTHPADAVGVGGRKGRIAPGADADLVALDDELRVLGTWVAGAR